MTFPPMIASYIVASAAPSSSPVEAIRHAQKAADEAYKTTLDSTALDDSPSQKLFRRMAGVDAPSNPEADRRAALAAAAEAFINNLPMLTSRRNTQAFIGAVAYGMACGYIKGKEAREFLYNAQLALAAFPARKRKTK